MAMAVGVALAARPSSSMLALTRQKANWVFNPLASSSNSAKPNSYSSSSPSRKLILYSKPGCCLCDGLKEKLQAAFSLSGSESLHDVDLQIRDITTNPEWERAYQYEIPVLARVLSDGTEQASNPIHTVANSLSLPGLELITKKLELPVKIVFPRNLLGGVVPGSSASDFMMLGLGDMDYWPASLKEFVLTLRSLALPREHADLQEILPSLHMASPNNIVLTQGMNWKKKHEVEVLAAVVHSIASDVGANTIVDVGAGQRWIILLLRTQVEQT